MYNDRGSNLEKSELSPEARTFAFFEYSPGAISTADLTSRSVFRFRAIQSKLVWYAECTVFVCPERVSVSGGLRGDRREARVIV